MIKPTRHPLQTATVVQRLLPGFLFTALLACCTLACAEKSDTPGNPAGKIPKGIILVMIDDIGYGDVAILSPSDLKTPNLDALFKESVRLTDYHVGTTCAPTRASLMTGRSVNAGGVWHTIAGRELLRQNEQTMADVFQSNGWATGIFGKWHLGEGYPFSPRFRGFETSVIHGGGGVRQQPDYWNNDYYTKIDFDGAPNPADVYLENGKRVNADRFCTDYWFHRSRQFIKDSLERDQPFFCYLPTNAAHGPFNAPHGFKEGFDGLIENVDTNMGQLDAFLAAEGIRDDVLLIFTTDNGTAGSRLGGLRGKKGSHYDGGHHVPCFWRWKNGGIGGSADAARDVTALTAAMDLLPTFMDLFQLKRPEGGQPLHGIALTKMLRNPDAAPSERTLVVDTQRTDNLVKWKKACVLHDQVADGKIVRKWRLTRTSEKVDCELYDFQSDRDTDNDLTSGNKDVVQQLRNAYESWWNEISPNWETYPPFVLDEEHEKELTLFSHSWIGTGSSPWNQQAIKRAAKGSRTHAIRFDKPGRYQIELRRWPREDGGLITGQSGSGEGAPVPAVAAHLEIQGVGQATHPVGAEDTSVIFEMDINSTRPTTIKTAFLDKSDKVLIGAYYVYIRKTSANEPPHGESPDP